MSLCIIQRESMSESVLFSTTSWIHVLYLLFYTLFDNFILYILVNECCYYLLCWANQIVITSLYHDCRNRDAAIWPLKTSLHWPLENSSTTMEKDYENSTDSLILLFIFSSQRELPTRTPLWSFPLTKMFRKARYHPHSEKIVCVCVCMCLTGNLTSQILCFIQHGGGNKNIAAVIAPCSSCASFCSDIYSLCTGGVFLQRPGVGGRLYLLCAWCQNTTQCAGLLFNTECHKLLSKEVTQLLVLF